MASLCYAEGFALLRQTTRQLVIASLRLRLASQTTRQLVNKTTSGAVAGTRELRIYGITKPSLECNT